MLDSAQVQGALRKAAAAIIGFVMAMVLLTALLLTGCYLLVQAAVLALSPWLGEAGAMGLAGFVCVLLLTLFLYRLSRPKSSTKSPDSADGKSGSGIDVLRNLIRENPLEAAALAFAVGIAEQGDPRLKSLLMEGGMILMKRTDGEQPDGGGTDEVSGQSGTGPQ
ncbi:MAG: hypothetical protein HLUCCX14_07930 [Marinobacter excellens HL-55]|uniref:Uncharacterized protein n=1 Tax=Marinobacter excellens HL-55 TaxID=1305731 RepID=A0A0P8B5U1_9GAMM|nr:MAG: hypothetical protein HLUCCX14_07930 [Marinobacter excellens HL-55]